MIKIKSHLYFWLFYIIWSFVNDRVKYGGEVHFFDVIVFMLIHHITIFYSVVFCLEKFNSKSRLALLKGVLTFIGFFLLFVSLKLFYRLYFIKLFNYPPYSEFQLNKFVIDSFSWYFQFFIWAIGYHFLKKSIAKERELRQKEEESFNLKERNFELQQQKLQLENAFLRSQINPHTLHNILNILYSKSIRADAPELSEAILVLSNLMRYSLESATDANGLVPLEKELEQINNTIKINQLRSSNKFYIDFKVEGDTGQAKIIPLMLITLVENAFKYAELNDETYPLQLHITLQQNSFVFYMHNKKRTVIVHETSHGIGLENTRQRLKAAYGEDGYTIDIKQSELYYTFTLTIHYLKNNADTNSNPIKKELATP
jgi:two-component system, LytTR family, sensor kinase